MTTQTQVPRGLLVDVLVAVLGEHQADVILAAVDARLSPPPLDPASEEELAAHKAAMTRAVAALAGTSGLKWRRWARSRYVVTCDGDHIGWISPVTSVCVSGRWRVRGWRPALCASTDQLPAAATVPAAAAVAHDAYRTSRTAHTRRAQ
jgi:hypothetical protein